MAVRKVRAQTGHDSELLALQSRLDSVTPEHFLLRAFMPVTTLERAYGLIDQGIVWHQAVVYAYIQEALVSYLK